MRSGNVYVEVLRTYELWVRSSRWFSFITLCALAMFILPLFVATNRSMALMWPIAMGLLFASFGLWLLVREQLVSDRGPTWPGYIAPQIVVFVVLAVVLFVGSPVLSGVLQKSAVCGRLAVSVFTFGLIGCVVVTAWWGFTAIGITAMFALFAPSFYRLLDQFLRGEYPLLAWVTIGLATGAIALLLAAMSRSTEESRLFRVAQSYNAARARARMTSNYVADTAVSDGGPQSGWLTSIFPDPMSPALFLAPVGLWTGAQKWRAVSNKNFLRMFGMWVMMIAFAGIPQAMSQQMVKPTPMLVIFCTMLPGSWALQMLRQQWRFLEVDSLRPIERGMLFKQLGLAVAISHLLLWTWMTATTVVAVQIFPNLFAAWSLPWMIAESFFMQVLVYGATVWALQYRSQGTLLGVLVLTMAPWWVAAVVWANGGDTSWLAPLTFVLAIVGVFLALAAYRRWLVTDLG